MSKYYRYYCGDCDYEYYLEKTKDICPKCNRMIAYTYTVQELPEGSYVGIDNDEGEKPKSCINFPDFFDEDLDDFQKKLKEYKDNLKSLYFN